MRQKQKKVFYESDILDPHFLENIAIKISFQPDVPENTQKPDFFQAFVQMALSAASLSPNEHTVWEMRILHGLAVSEIQHVTTLKSADIRRYTRNANKKINRVVKGFIQCQSQIKKIK